MTSVGFVPCLPPGLHPGMDALAHGLLQELEENSVGLRVFPSDLRGGSASVASSQAAAVERALAAGMRAIVLFVLDVNEPARAVASALANGVPVVAIHQPAYPVSAAIVVPNYHQGVALAHALGRLVKPGARVAILGGPRILDDVELVRGAVAGVTDAGFELANDPFLERYRNLDDVRGAGKRAAAALLDECSPFDGWIVFNDETALDALEVLEQRGLAGAVPTVSRNGSPAIVREIEGGRTSASFDYRLPELGVLAGRTLLTVFSGTTPAGSLITAPIGALVTPATAAAYVPWELRARPRELPVGAA